MNEYIINMSNSQYQSTSCLLSVDVSQLREEIVRCRDCMYYKEEVFEWVSNLKRTKKTCDLFDGCYVKPDGYCAWGERRND